MVYCPAFAVLFSAAVGASAVTRSASSMSVSGGTITVNAGGSDAVIASVSHTPGARPEARSAARQLRSWLRRVLGAATQAEGVQTAPAQAGMCPVVSQYCKTNQAFSTKKQFTSGTICLGTCYDRQFHGKAECASETEDFPHAFCTRPCEKMTVPFEADMSKHYNMAIEHCRDGAEKWRAFPEDADFAKAQTFKTYDVRKIMKG